MEHQQDPAKPSLMFISVVVIIAIAIPLLIIASLAFGLQPTLSKNASTSSGGTTVIIPVGVGTNQSLNYEPVTVTVVVGVNNTILWTENDPIPHTVTSNQVPSGVESFDSGNLNKGDSFSVTLNIPGTYLYHCSYHGWMKGTIIVKSS